MFSRIGYALRETWASFRRNLTLTAAAVLTSAVSLLLVGTTFLIQRAFENLLVQRPSTRRNKRLNAFIQLLNSDSLVPLVSRNTCFMQGLLRYSEFGLNCIQLLLCLLLNRQNLTVLSRFRQSLPALGLSVCVQQ